MNIPHKYFPENKTAGEDIYSAEKNIEQNAFNLLRNRHGLKGLL